ALALAEASERRGALAAEATGDHRGRLLSEARFGLLQAMAEAEDPAIEPGLLRCTASLVRHEVESGRLGSALSLLDELDGHDVPELREQAAALRREAEDQRRLQDLARDLDPGVAASWRVRYLTGLVGLMTGVGVA